MDKKVILLTGGGSAGHVTPNMALIPLLHEKGYDIHYVGTQSGIERELISAFDYVTYHTIEAGKLRRYFSLKNLSDPARVIKGISQARRIIRDIKPDVVFSKGGFVSVPVVIGARGKCPIIAHESDYTPGLANKIASRYATKVLVTFEDTLRYVGDKGTHTGTPIRQSLYGGNREKGLSFSGFDGKKPIMLVMGGSLGAQKVNESIRNQLDTLTKRFDIIHICGKGKMEEPIVRNGYHQYEYIKEELPDIFACTDIMVSRSGANSVFEILALAIPALLIPLSQNASRGDQVLNARYFERKGYSHMLLQEDITDEKLIESINEVYENRDNLKSVMKNEKTADGTDKIIEIIESYL